MLVVRIDTETSARWALAFWVVATAGLLVWLLLG